MKDVSVGNWPNGVRRRSCEDSSTVTARLMEWPEGAGDGVAPGEDTVCFLLILLAAVTGVIGLRGPPFSSDMAKGRWMFSLDQLCVAASSGVFGVLSLSSSVGGGCCVVSRVVGTVGNQETDMQVQARDRQSRGFEDSSCATRGQAS